MYIHNRFWEKDKKKRTIDCGCGYCTHTWYQSTIIHYYLASMNVADNVEMSHCEFWWILCTIKRRGRGKRRFIEINIGLWIAKLDLYFPTMSCMSTIANLYGRTDTRVLWKIYKSFISWGFLVDSFGFYVRRRVWWTRLTMSEYIPI